MTTIPIQMQGATDLYLNLDGGYQGSIQVELLDPSTGEVIPGFGRRDNGKLTGSSTSRRVLWEEGKSLGTLANRPFQIRFHLAGQGKFPRLYSFRFE